VSGPLPKGWAETTLASICSHRSGSSKLIKGKLHAEQRPGRYQGFSAAGPDVWCDGWITRARRSSSPPWGCGAARRSSAGGC
jgi:hypothetical protein